MNLGSNFGEVLTKVATCMLRMSNNLRKILPIFNPSLCVISYLFFMYLGVAKTKQILYFMLITSV